MNSRSTKYYEDKKTVSRTEKNKYLYEETSPLNVNYINLANPEELYDKPLKSRLEYKEENIAVATLEEETPKERKSYNINEILAQAKEKKQIEEKKRLINTEYNILTKLDLDKINSIDLSKEKAACLIDEVYPTREREDTNQELFDDLIDEDDINELTQEKIKEKPVFAVDEKIEDASIKEKIKQEEKEEQTEIDEAKEKNFMNDTTSTTDIIKLEKKSKISLIIIIILVVLLLAGGVYLILKYFGTL